MEGNQQEKKVEIVGNYELLELLEEDAFGQKYLTRNKDDNKLYVVKKLPKSKVNETEKSRQYFDAEIGILKKLSGHPNIIRFNEMKETKNDIYTIHEHINGGGLTEILQKYKKEKGRPFTEEIVQHLMKQICEAIRYIHEKRIIHCDLKLGNILVNFPNPTDKEKMNLLGAQVKIIGFYVAFDQSQGKDAVTFVGTPINMAPEVLEKGFGKGEGKPYDNKVDIWSLGTICYELLIGHLPFEAKTMEELLKTVEKGVFEVPSSISAEAMNFIKAMLKHDGAERKSAVDLLSMPFLTKSVSEFTPLSK